MSSPPPAPGHTGNRATLKTQKTQEGLGWWVVWTCRKHCTYNHLSLLLLEVSICSNIRRRAQSRAFDCCFHFSFLSSSDFQEGKGLRLFSFRNDWIQEVGAGKKRERVTKVREQNLLIVWDSLQCPRGGGQWSWGNDHWVGRWLMKSAFCLRSYAQSDFLFLVGSSEVTFGEAVPWMAASTLGWSGSSIHSPSSCRWQEL